MFTVLVGIACLFVGWNLPQPEFAKRFQDWVVALFKGTAE